MHLPCMQRCTGARGGQQHGMCVHARQLVRWAADGLAATWETLGQAQPLYFGVTLMCRETLELHSIQPHANIGTAATFPEAGSVLLQCPNLLGEGYTHLQKAEALAAPLHAAALHAKVHGRWSATRHECACGAAGVF